MSTTPADPSPKPRRKAAPNPRAAPRGARYPRWVRRRRSVPTFGGRRGTGRRPPWPRPPGAATDKDGHEPHPEQERQPGTERGPRAQRRPHQRRARRAGAPRAEVAATQALPQGVWPGRRSRARPTAAGGPARSCCCSSPPSLAPLSALATFTRSTLLDTDKYLAMVAPLASDPAVQEEISRRITDAVFEQLKVKELTTQTLDAIARPTARGGGHREPPVQLSTFAEPISNAIYGFTEGQVSNLVASSTFQDAWVAANREAHASLVSALTGENTERRASRSRRARCRSTSPRSSRRSSRCSSSGGCPSPTGSPRSTPSSSCSRATTSARPRRPSGCSTSCAGCCRCSRSWPSSRRGGARSRPAGGRLVIGASMVVGSLVLLLLGIQLLRALYLDDLEQVLLVPQVATVLFDTVTTPLRLAVRSTAVLFLVIALAAWLAGPSSAAVAVRSVPRRLSGMTRRPTRALGAVSRFAAQYTVPLRAAVGGLAVLAVLVGDRPSAGAVLVIAVLARPRR